MLADIGREIVVEKPHITRNQYKNARVAAENVRLSDQQCENTCRIRINSTRPELSVTNVKLLDTLCMI